jgi:hypothetical protein
MPLADLTGLRHTLAATASGQDRQFQAVLPFQATLISSLTKAAYEKNKPNIKKIIASFGNLLLFHSVSRSGYDI